MDTIDIFPWDDNFKTGLPSVDEQHRRLVELLNQLAGHVAFKSDQVRLDQIFAALADYTVYHFTSEEGIWQAYLGGDPAEIEHRQQHAAFVDEVNRMRGELGSRPLAELAEEALGFLARWLAAHILETDRYLAYTVLAMQEGLSLPAAKVRAREQISGATQALIDIILSIYSVLSSNTLKLMRELVSHRQVEEQLHKAKQALENSQDLLLKVIDTVPMRVFWKDGNLRYLGANRAFARDAGKSSPDELIGEDDFQMSWAANAEAYRSDDRAVIASGIAKLSYEEPQNTPDGRTIWLRSSKVPLTGENGKAIGVLGVYDDIAEWRNAIAALRASEAKFHSLYSAMAEGVALHELVFGADGTTPVDYRLFDVNPAYETILGMSSQSVIGRRGSEVYGQALFLEQFAAVATTGQPLRFKGEVASLGKTFSISVFSPAKNQFATVFRDVTKEARAEQLLREQEERLRLALGASDKAWFDLDVTSGKISVSPNYPGMLGQDPQTFEGTLSNWFDNIHRDDLPVVKEKFAECLHHGGARTIEYRRRTQSSQWIWFESVGNVVQWDSEGRPLRLIGIHTDISAHKKAIEEQQRLNRALRLLSECNLRLVRDQSETQLLDDICRLIVESGGYRMVWIGYAQQDADKTIVPIVHAGSGAEAYLAQSIISWDEASAAGRGPVGRAIQTGCVQINQDYRDNPEMAPWLPLADHFGYQASIGLPLTVGGKHIGVISMYAGEPYAFNAEEVKLLAELARNLGFGIETLRTRQQRNAAEAASRAKSTFLANMSHELRTPMNAIMGLTELVLRHTSEPKLQSQLGKISQASQHLLQVINDILDISKIEAERVTLERANFKLWEVLQNIRNLTGQKAEAKGLKFAIDLPAELPELSLCGDATRLRQILLNLVGNSIKFTASGAVTLTVRVQEEQPTNVLIRWDIRDTGIGISEEDQRRLFTAFEQADASMTRKYGGTGLGLAISKRLVALMGGEIGVDSRLGEGSNFWFTVRLDKVNGQRAPLASASGAALAPEASIMARHAGKRVLLAEDEPINQEVASSLLEECGLLVDLAQDGQEALDLAGKNPYDLILMDIQMPRLNGLEATSAIRQRLATARLPILAMTANAFDEDKRICLEAGMNDHIAKPIEPEQLFQTLLKWLDWSAENAKAQ